MENYEVIIDNHEDENGLFYVYNNETKKIVSKGYKYSRYAFNLQSKLELIQPKILQHFHMKTIELQDEEYFTYCEDENNLVSSGELVGTYILCENIKCDNFQTVICVDTKQIYLISKP